MNQVCHLNGESSPSLETAGLQVIKFSVETSLLKQQAWKQFEMYQALVKNWQKLRAKKQNKFSRSVFIL